MTEEQNPEQLIEISRRRRSKIDGTCRKFTCDDCGKEYLSQPALNNHRKTKHPEKLDPGEEKRGRGRPKKILSSLLHDPYNERFEKYFETENRKKFDDDPVDLNNLINNTYNDIFALFHNRCFSHPSTWKEHRLMNSLLTDEVIPRKINERSIDDVLYEYLLFIKASTNSIYFTLVLKFTILYREAINKLKHIEEAEEEYTAIFTPEEIPNYINYFITDFMESNMYFGFSDYEKDELIEIIQHFCFWLYKNGYSCYKVSLNH